MQSYAAGNYTSTLTGPPTQQCLSVSSGGTVWGCEHVFSPRKRPAFEMRATGTSLSMSFGEMSKTKRRAPWK